MKSKIMRKGPPLTFVEDAKVLADLPDETFYAVVSHVEAFFQKGLLYDDDLLAPISEKFGIPIRDLSTSLRFASFVANEVAKEGDNVGNILDDLISLDALNKSQAQAVGKKLEVKWSSLVGSVTDAVRAVYELTAALPTLAFCNVSCALIGRYFPEFDHLKDVPNSYEPKVLQMVPTSIVQLDVYRYGDTDRVAFALTDLELDQMINRLQAAKIKLKALASQIPERK